VLINWGETSPSGHRPVLPLHRGTGVHQQLHQPSHLRRQVPRVPERRQTSDGEDEAESAAPVSSYIHQVITEAVVCKCS